MKTKNAFLFILFSSFLAFGQDCTAKLTYTLANIKGGFYANQTVSLTAKDGSKTFIQKSDANGMVTFDVPCETLFDLKITNYTHPEEAISGKAGSQSRQVLSYEPNMKEKDALFAMSATEKAALEKTLSLLPDTTKLPTGMLKTPPHLENYELMSIKLKDLNNGLLINEDFIITGTNRKKSFQGKTSKTGEIQLYIPKGDNYTLNFKYHKAYKKFDSEFKNGTINSRMEITYMGTKEYEKRKKEEEDRIKAEEKRLAEDRLAFEKYCKERRVSLEEGYKLKLKEATNGTSEDDVVTKVLTRNKWSEKLIVCDLTGSMDPYAQQLSVWYQLNFKKEPNLQFVFFNDGDEKDDSEKKIGSTGGIYYQKSTGLDSLIYLMSFVRSRGNGGDCPENNLEALIKGVKKAQPYKELVMIVDNNAPVKDISLLNQFTKPVHIILCGSTRGEVLSDYLLIAWKTKGSIHTIEEDISKIATMSEGQTIQIGGYTYKILGGEFVRITKA
ncbi:hypothetical protein [Fluviicola taffensis]|uniref:VWFA domain-containing protein n=1 Tax=Fluviicola taffensis (strain DSM 16823 / NCIMB 13979 / RW262) TaxID=755732 RepID=F2IIF8_FLUTR|nr:hypothetical protein [Fluviicola taffensis]AEA44884.1 hypothetical protein Fluta_2905 [Fluviicola taffensis DSM 16823]